jgi:4-hydroxybenzoate polyprenyltransferase
LAAAVLAGQFSIGWSNDVFDAPRDTAAGRTDKPIASGAISARSVAVAAGMAVVAGLVGGFLIGPVAGLAHVSMVLAGWAYNAGLKSHVTSGLMYVLGFGPIPVVAAATLPGQPLPRPWTVAAAALLGLGGHFANVLPDLAGDAAGGVRGLPQRVATVGGPGAVRLVALLLLLTASVVIVLAPGLPPPWYAGAGLAVAAGLAVFGARAGGRWPFLAAIAIALLDAVLFVTSGAALI